MIKLFTPDTLLGEEPARPVSRQPPRARTKISPVDENRIVIGKLHILENSMEMLKLDLYNHRSANSPIETNKHPMMLRRHAAA